MRTALMRRGSIAVFGLTLLAACTNREASSREVDTDSTGAGGYAARSDSAPLGAMSDANILAVLDEVNVADSASGFEASTKGTSSDVREYGKMMMEDHHEMRVRGQEAAQAQSLSPMAPSMDPFASAVDSGKTALSTTAKGRSWDSTYIAHAAAMHAQLLGWMNEVGTQGRSDAMRSLIDDARPTVQKHLDRAQDILAKFNKADTSRK